MLPITPRPCDWSGVCVSTGSTATSWLRSSVQSWPVVALRIELSTTWLSAACGPPALGYRIHQSGWQDSNLRLRAPKARGFAATRHPVCPRAPSTQMTHGQSCALSTQWVGRCSNPRPLVFSEVLHHLSYRPNDKNKKPDVVVTPGFRYSSGIYGQASQAQGIARHHIRRLKGECTRRFALFEVWS